MFYKYVIVYSITLPTQVYPQTSLKNLKGFLKENVVFFVCVCVFILRRIPVNAKL